MEFEVFALGVSTAAVVVAVLISVSQMRQMVRQTTAMHHDMFEGLVGSFMSQWTTFLLQDPDLCAWFLESRGLPDAGVEENKRRVYAVVRFDSHESIYLQRTLRGLRDQSWVAWSNVLRADLEVPEFREVWTKMHRLFDTDFIEHVDGMLHERTEAAVTEEV